jgi:hypothetical protein
MGKDGKIMQPKITSEDDKLLSNPLLFCSSNYNIKLHVKCMLFVVLVVLAMVKALVVELHLSLSLVNRTLVLC